MLLQMDIAYGNVTAADGPDDPSEGRLFWMKFIVLFFLCCQVKSQGTALKQTTTCFKFIIRISSYVSGNSASLNKQDTNSKSWYVSECTKCGFVINHI